VKTQLKISRAAQLIEQEIERFGPMSFARFVELALYHPMYGYYNRKASPRGRSGDYFTAGQVSDLFPEIVAEAVAAMMTTMESEQFSIIEVGAGFGEILEGILISLKEKGFNQGVKVWAVEKSGPARDELWRKLSRFPKCEIISSLDEIEMVGGVEGLIFSNELFDALPFHRHRFYGSGWKEIFINLKGGKLVEEELLLSDPKILDGLGLEKKEFEEGQEIEVRPDAGEILEQWASNLTRGYIMTFDYGYSRKDLYGLSHLHGTWQCFHRHRINQHPLENIGEQDITAHVDFTRLGEVGETLGFTPSFFSSQGIFLTHLGKDVIEKKLQGLQASSEGKSALEHRSFAGSLQQLLHPDGMGEKFKVLIQTKAAKLPPVFQSIPNRLKSL